MEPAGLKTIAAQTRALLAHALRASDASPRLTFFAGAVIVFLCIGVATAVRFAIEAVVADVVPFATFFPAIAVAAIVGGFRTGVATWLLSIAIGLFLFVVRGDGTVFTVSQATSTALFAASAGLELLIATWLRDLFWESQRNVNRYRALTDASSHLISTFDAAGACQTPQPGWEKLTGTQWPAYRGFAWLEQVHEEDRAKLIVNGQAASSEVRVRDGEGVWRWFAVNAVPVTDAEGGVSEYVASLTEITERKQTQERGELLLNDLRHRLKNFIAVIQALVIAAKPKGNADIDAFAETFLSRVRTLQSAGDLVMKANAEDVDLAEVVPAALAPFMGGVGSPIAIDGPPLMLKEHTVGAVALACHELATNSAKYGALSVPPGRVSIKWWRKLTGDEESVEIHWIERDGPPVAKPTRQGFGTRIITAAMSREPNGAVHLDYHPHGLHCRMTFAKPVVQKAAE